MLRIRNRFDAKIVLSRSLFIPFMIGVYMHNDIQNMQLDTIRISEQTVGAFASAIHIEDQHLCSDPCLRLPNRIHKATGRALCGAKQSERNQVVVSGPESGVTETCFAPQL